MGKERFEVFGKIIKDNEDIPALLDNYLATVRLNELNDKVKELKQELAELKEKDNYHLRYELAGADETITNLKKQLAEKDKEIERLKDFIGCKGCVDVIKKSNEDQTQLAIQELEKLKASADKWFESWENSKYEGNIYDKLDVSNAYLQMSCEIDQQIKELKGEKQ